MQENKKDYFMNTRLEFVYFFPQLGLALLRDPEDNEYLMVEATDHGQDKTF